MRTCATYRKKLENVKMQPKKSPQFIDEYIIIFGKRAVHGVRFYCGIYQTNYSRILNLIN